MTSTTVQLLDGREVTTDHPDWRTECLERHSHVLRMRRLDTNGRRLYIEDIRRQQGDAAANRLRDAYGRDWEQRKAALAAAAKESSK